ncbi:hypothetical protein [Streptosporangium carneum]|uniref:Uncharacterized protein n=1 Tax=Streptosporangium carneum TaxID=47481 RepID=A0A9W6MGY3_9ACTN|nr:hypothetical protein [Streptosporangium carneum]GLK13600.1 hypothetical protein GCM10017600_70110 [Streptosporangium carneum]
MAETPFNGLTLGGTGPARVVSFTKDKLEQLGTDFGGRANDVDALVRHTGSIGIDPPAFGVLGIGLNSAHDQARDNAVNALKAGKAVIESWNKALKDADANYQAAEGKSTDDGGGGNPWDGGGLGGGLGGGGLGGGGLGGGGLDLPKPDDLNGSDLSGGDDLDLDGTGPKYPDPNDLDGTGPKYPDPNDLDSDGTGPKFPDPNALDPGGTGSNLTDPKLPDPNALDPNSVANNLAKTGLGLDDPTRTALSGYDPNQVTAQPRLPDSTTWTGDSQGPGSTRGGFSGGVSGGGAVPLGGLRGTGVGAGGTGGVPMMPMMPPGGAGGDQEKEREKTTWMSEDEGVWGGDEDIAPPVIGQD